MREHILFIDTETSGLPKKWDAPYDSSDNWPFIVQIAWVIYTWEGKLLKTENHYIKDTDYQISQDSSTIHGISREFLYAHGKERAWVMKTLQQDLLEYSPLLVGHFMQLDYHMIELGFYRAGLENPATQLPSFCTMKVTSNFIRQRPSKYLKLGELYERLFKEPLQDQHNALTDAQATAACFFEMIRQGDIKERLIDKQQKSPKKAFLKAYLSLAVIVLLLFFVLLFMLCWK